MSTYNNKRAVKSLLKRRLTVDKVYSSFALCRSMWRVGKAREIKDHFFLSLKKSNFSAKRKTLIFMIRYYIALLLFSLVWLVSSCQSAPQEEEATDNRPNILFAIADDASFPHMGAYGTDWVESPAFDRVANEGILFTRAYTPNAKCAPSRSCILTGRNSWQLGAAANHWPFFPDEFKTYPEVLTEASACWA